MHFSEAEQPYSDEISSIYSSLIPIFADSLGKYAPSSNAKEKEILHSFIYVLCRFIYIKFSITAIISFGKSQINACTNGTVKF